jgi:hypothetical protein
VDGGRLSLEGGGPDPVSWLHQCLQVGLLLLSNESFFPWGGPAALARSPIQVWVWPRLGQAGIRRDELSQALQRGRQSVGSMEKVQVAPLGHHQCPDRARQ